MENEPNPPPNTVDIKGKRGKAHRPKSSSSSNKTMSLSMERTKTLTHDHAHHKGDLHIIDSDDAPDDSRINIESRTTADLTPSMQRDSTWCNDSISTGSNVSLGLPSRSSPESISGSRAGSSPVSKVPSFWERLKSRMGSKSSVGSMTPSYRDGATTPNRSLNGSKTPEELFQKHSSRSVDSGVFNSDVAAKRKLIVGNMVKNTDSLAEKQYEEMQIQREKEKKEEEERKRKAIELKKLQAVKGILDGTEQERRMYALQYYFDQDKKHQGFMMTSFCKLLLRHPKTGSLLKEYIQEQKEQMGLTLASKPTNRDETVKVIAQKWMKNTGLGSQSVEHFVTDSEEGKNTAEIKGVDRFPPIRHKVSTHTEGELLKSKSIAERHSKSNVAQRSDATNTTIGELADVHSKNVNENKTETIKENETETSTDPNVLLEQQIKARLNKKNRRKTSKHRREKSGADAITSEVKDDTKANVGGIPRTEQMLHDNEDNNTRVGIPKSGTTEDKDLEKHVKSLAAKQSLPENDTRSPDNESESKESGNVPTEHQEVKHEDPNILLEQQIKARLNKKKNRRITSKHRREKSEPDTVTSEVKDDTKAMVAGYPRSEQMLHDNEDDSTQGSIPKPGSIEDKDLARYVKSLEDAVDGKLKTILIDDITTPHDLTNDGGGPSGRGGKLTDKGQTDYILT